MHLFTGERKQVKKSKGAPAWMADKIWKPIIKKVGVEKLEKPETEAEKVDGKHKWIKRLLLLAFPFIVGGSG